VSALDALAALAVGAARVWHPRLPARFEVQDVGPDGEGWDIVEDWSVAAAPVVVEPGPRPSRAAPEPPPPARTPPRAPVPGPVRSPAPAPADVLDERPSDPPASPSAVSTTLARPDAEPPADPARHRRPAPTLHVTVHELADPAQADEPAPVAAPLPVPVPTAALPVRRRPAPPEPAEEPVAPSAPPGPPRPGPRSTPSRPQPRAEPRRPALRPTVHVHIDRVDVRAAMPTTPPPATVAPPERRPAGPDLEAYLRDGREVPAT
jgi:hypothetical protein